MAEGDSWDADTFDPDELAAIGTKKTVVADKWEGEDDDDDIKDNWDDDEEEFKKAEEKKAAETKLSEKKKLAEKIKEKESLQMKKQEELRKRLEESQETELSPEDELAEKLRVKKLQEEADLLLAQEAFGVVNNVKGIDAISPSSKDDFTEFEKLLKDKISPFESSIHYSGFLESLFRDLCLSLEVEDLKRVSNSLTVLLSEKQKQEKLNKGKKKKKGLVSAGGMKSKMKDDLADYGEFDGGYVQDYEDFM
ncbi:eukaryotic translation initiation factor 3 subunit J-A isoform X2 [Salmo salar]|uniref:Eukaryotic translation initiation factor 3 subunit J n=1 Tax=Salmo salar TaxID=8030 RepID=A0A1S3KT28_SALSA|nr:eukaryotic translation initiation factor 3 subunit J-A-like isoform X2 [Salmo salar]|eukprot:XP_013981464.1 PREDICTED: eukaryotic translation initiation factor 3 subunit J-A-like isoform X2 [Salmo salar]